ELVRGEINEGAADDIANSVAALTAERQRVAVTVVFCDDAARIEIVGNKPLIDDCELDDPCRFGKSLFRRLRVASLGFEGEISRPIVPYLRGAGLERSDRTDDMLQCLP